MNHCLREIVVSFYLHHSIKLSDICFNFKSSCHIVPFHDSFESMAHLELHNRIKLLTSFELFIFPSEKGARVIYLK